MEQIIQINDTDFSGNRLIFAETTDGTYTIENKEYESLGYLEKRRVGAWMTWCLFLNKDCYLTAGCQDEVREMTKRLNVKANKQPNNDNSQSKLKELIKQSVTFDRN